MGRVISSIHLIAGKIEATVYDIDDELLELTVTMYPGDCLLIKQGQQHRITQQCMVEPTDATTSQRTFAAVKLNGVKCKHCQVRLIWCIKILLTDMSTTVGTSCMFMHISKIQVM